MTKHTEQQKQIIIKALDLIDSRNMHVATTCSRDIVDAWLKFNAVIDMFCFEFSALRPNYETINQIYHDFNSDEIKTIIEAMQILDQEVQTGNLDDNCKMTYQSLFNEHYFENAFKDIMWKVAGE